MESTQKSLPSVRTLLVIVGFSMGGKTNLTNESRRAKLGNIILLYGRDYVMNAI